MLCRANAESWDKNLGEAFGLFFKNGGIPRLQLSYSYDNMRRETYLRQA